MAIVRNRKFFISYTKCSFQNNCAKTTAVKKIPAFPDQRECLSDEKRESARTSDAVSEKFLFFSGKIPEA